MTRKRSEAEAPDGAMLGRLSGLPLRLLAPDRSDAASRHPGLPRMFTDHAHGDEDTTRVQCPRCNGKGETEVRTENATGYSIRQTECWLCRGSRMVTPVECAEFRGAP